MFVVNNVAIKDKMYLERVTGIQMAKKLSISQGAFYKKINGKREFTGSELGMLAFILKTDVNFFYTSWY